jgi:hypothetical protein
LPSAPPLLRPAERAAVAAAGPPSASQPVSSYAGNIGTFAGELASSLHKLGAGFRAA